MSWKNALQVGQEAVLATSSKSGKPRAIVVVSLGFLDDKLIIGACQMKTSLENLKDNKKVSILAKNENEYYRIDGTSTIYSSGKYFEVATKRSSPPLPKHAIVVDIEEIFDLDRMKRVNPTNSF